MNEEYKVQPCPKARMVNQFKLEEFKADLIKTGVPMDSIKVVLSLSPHHSRRNNLCDECIGTGFVPFEAWDMYDPDCLVSCYCCDGSGLDDAPL
jgi:hypothetical protein